VRVYRDRGLTGGIPRSSEPKAPPWTLGRVPGHGRGSSGENIRSKNKVAQVNEVLYKLIAYNLTRVVHEIFEAGIAPLFARTAVLISTE
jgi:hypothetical protein